MSDGPSDEALEAEDQASEGHVYIVFGDLMAGVLGLFVMFFVWAMIFQVDLTTHLVAERAAREVQEERAKTLEAALAGPLATGRITLIDGRIGIAGSVLFDLYSADLRAEGNDLLAQIATPLAQWLDRTDLMVMVGGFTDDLPIRGDERKFLDNWELSTERSLTVVRALARHGVPPDRLFAAGFGEHHPAVPNQDEEGRQRNRRVEIAPVPRQTEPVRGPR